MSSQPLTWLITGVNSGLGLELALIAREAGHTVIGSVRSISKFPSKLSSAGVIPLELSLPAPDETLEAAVASVQQKHGQIDVLVNNAGYSHLSAVEEATGAEVRKQMEVNVYAPLALARAVLPSMRARKSGVIVNVTSIAGVMAFPGAGIYCGSKFALEGLTETLASEVAPFGVRVHIVEPGYFRTNFLGSTETGGPDGSRNNRIAAYDDANAQYAAYHGKQPGDPHKGMQRLFELVTNTGMAKGLEKQLRLPLGSDCVGFIESKIKSFQENFEATRQVAMSTDL